MKKLLYLIVILNFVVSLGLAYKVFTTQAVPNYTAQLNALKSSDSTPSATPTIHLTGECNTELTQSLSGTGGAAGINPDDSIQEFTLNLSGTTPLNLDCSLSD